MKSAPWFLAATLACSLGLSSARAQAASAPLFFTCDAKARDIALETLKQAPPSPDVQAADLAAAKAAIAKAMKRGEDALAGLDGPAPYVGAAHWARLAKTTPSPRAAELFRRAARDQLTRNHASAAMTRTDWAAGLSDAALGYAYRVIRLESCSIDQDNTDWLKGELRDRGWFTLREYGEDAESAAFLLVQHADRDVNFQAEVLAMLQTLAAKGEARLTSYAFLYDRVAVAQGRPQRYGTQGRCTGPGVWQPFEIEDPAGVDQRRATIDQPPTAQSAAAMAQFCRFG